MAYRIAHSLDTLRDQVNAAYPGRSKVSDGWIGDAKHRSRTSDHNPWIVVKKNGRNVRIVSALDITHDPNKGLDARQLAEALVHSRDKRIKYIISNGQIVSGKQGLEPWVWRRYRGSNPHTKHVHISVEDEEVLFDDRTPWVLELKKSQPLLFDTTPRATLRKGSKGEGVYYLQSRLNTHGASLKVDGDFGNVTDKAVRLFQRTNGLHPDGIVGPYTWEKLDA